MKALAHPMKSSSYYSRKASACVELGRWCAAKEWQFMAKKARRIEKERKARKALKSANQ